MSELYKFVSCNHRLVKDTEFDWCQWLILVILAIQVAETEVQSQPRQIVRETLSRNTPIVKKGQLERLKV
jgi:hypothetical protein